MPNLIATGSPRRRAQLKKLFPQAVWTEFRGNVHTRLKKLAGGAECAKSLWLHPEWSKSGDPRLLGAIADFVVSRGGLWRAGWQVHKLYRVR